MKSLISIQNVSKAFGKHKALNNVSLEIEKGEIFALLGPNGAGKTTLISAICGLCRQSSGDITVNSFNTVTHYKDTCLLYTSDAADDNVGVDLGGRRIIKKRKK